MGNSITVPPGASYKHIVPFIKHFPGSSSITIERKGQVYPGDTH